MDTLEEEARDAFCFLCETEFVIGTASLADLDERWAVLEWLESGSNDPGSDPRGSDGSPPGDAPRDDAPPANRETDKTQDETVDGTGSSREPQAKWLRFVPHGISARWCFTKNDDDFYPSVPHGHLGAKTNPWPKLNPYTGRAYKQKDVENPQLRLTRSEMIILWNDREFRRHALETIVWYSENHAYYRFPVARPYRLPRWRRRR